MSGICDTCRRTTCEYRADDIAVCGLPKTETNWERLFGMPERAAVTLVRTSDERAVCKLPTWTASSNDYEAWLEWLRGDA